MVTCSICGRQFGNNVGLGVHRKFAHGVCTTTTPAQTRLTTQQDTSIYIPSGVVYDDWSGAVQKLQTLYKHEIFCLILGPKGSGKTTLVKKFAETISKPLFGINFSLRTRESHLVGTTMMTNGSTFFSEGIIPQSMRAGGVLYLDELNAAEPDVLVRLDEVLDDRRELILKEYDGRPIKAAPGWYVIATINPLSHVGTKELPPQLLSRFPARLILDYPEESTELKIVKLHAPNADDESLKIGIRLANKLRSTWATGDIYYAPSIRETIAFAKLVSNGTSPREAADLVFTSVYYQWGVAEKKKVEDLVHSIFGGSS